jgi:methionyl-tRNA formyltransferase
MEIVFLGDPILRRQSEPVKEIDGALQEFVNAMIEAMHVGRGIGLAAVQVGTLARVFVTHVPDDEPRVFINPQIVETSVEQWKYEEGCLSIPGLNADVVRPAGVKIQAWSPKGKPFTMDVEGLLARVVQHEYDHLDGRAVHRPAEQGQARKTAAGLRPDESRVAMRVLFAGTPELAVPALKGLVARHDVCGVLTNPARAAGRGGREAEPAVADAAGRLGLRVLQPDRLGPAEREVIRALEPEVLAVVAYGRIFGPRFLALFPRGGVNLHPSLLPRYRGPSPIQAALCAGDAETGLTVQTLAAQVDAGDILAQERVAVDPDETAVELSARLADMGAALLGATLDRMALGALAGQPQDDGAATFCRMIEKGDGLVRWGDSARSIYNHYRAYQPWPGVFTAFKAMHLAIRACRPDGGGETAPTGQPGQVLSMDRSGALLVQTGAGALRVTELQLQQKKAMDARSFVNGHRDILGAVLGSG